MNLLISLACLFSTLALLASLAIYRRDFSAIATLQSRTFDEDSD